MARGGPGRAGRQPSGIAELLRCGAGPAFPPSAFDEPVGVELLDTAEAAGLRQVLAENPGILAHEVSGWRLLGQDDQRVLFGAGEPPLLSAYVVIGRARSGWEFRNSGGDAIVRPYRPPFQLARWGLVPDRPPPDVNSEVIELIVNDSGCASGKSPEHRLRPPELAIHPETVTITFTGLIPEGVQTCPSHPPVRRTVELPGPLGSRRLLDGGIYPPQPPCRIDPDRGDCLHLRDELHGGAEL